MAIKDLLLFGNPILYEKSEPVQIEEIPLLFPKIELMFDTEIDFRKNTALNPELSILSSEMFEVWDDCMSFPNLLVQVMRHNQNSGYDLSRNENNRAMREVARIEKAVLNY